MECYKLSVLKHVFSSHGIHPGIRVRIFTAGYPSGVPHIESEDFKSHVSFSFQYECHVSFSSRVFSTLPTTKVLEMKEDQVKAPESEGCVEMVIWNTWVATVVPQHLDPGNLVIFYGHIQQFNESLDLICVNGWRVKAFRLASMEFSFVWCVHLIQKSFAFDSHRNLLSLPRCWIFRIALWTTTSGVCPCVATSKCIHLSMQFFKTWSKVAN